MSAPFTAKPTTLKRFLTPSGGGFYIPLYQRSYRWRASDVTRLVDDIIAGITRFTNDQSSTFIGTIITVANRSDLFPPATELPSRVFQIIDGQQRIATLLCMCGELRRAVNSASALLTDDDQEIFGPLVEGHISALEKPLFLTISDASGSPLPRMIRGGADCWSQEESGYRSEIGQYLLTYDLQHDRPLLTGNLLFDQAINRLYRTFGADQLFGGAIERLDNDKRRILLGLDCSSNFEHNQSNRLRDLLVFSRFLQDHVHAISVEASDPNSAYTIFESLNTTGESLSAFETFVPLVVSKVGGQSNYADSWEKLQIDRCNEALNGDNPGQISARTTKALIAFALSDTGDKIGKPLHEQRSYLKKYPFLPAEHRRIFLRGLNSTATCLNHLWHRNNPLPMASEHTRVALQMLIDSGHIIPQALLTRGYEEFIGHDPSLFYRLIRVVADFWLLWRLARSTTHSIDNHYRSLMAGMEVQDSRTLGPYSRRPRQYHDQTRSPHPDDVANDLKWILQYKGGIFDRDTWVNKVTDLAHGRSKRGGHRKLLRYALLGAYHDAVPDARNFLRCGTPRSSVTLTSSWYSAELTLEHIAPRNRNPADQTWDDEIYSERRVHRLGNLTLLPKEENQTLGNLSWEKKKEYFSVFSERDFLVRQEQINNFDFHRNTRRLLDNDFVPFCSDLARCSADCWTAPKVAQRGRILACMIWSRFAPSLSFDV